MKNLEAAALHHRRLDGSHYPADPHALFKKSKYGFPVIKVTKQTDNRKRPKVTLPKLTCLD